MVIVHSWERYLPPWNDPIVPLGEKNSLIISPWVFLTEQRAVHLQDTPAGPVGPRLIHVFAILRVRYLGPFFCLRSEHIDANRNNSPLSDHFRLFSYAAQQMKRNKQRFFVCCGYILSTWQPHHVVLVHTWIFPKKMGHDSMMMVQHY